MRYIRNLPCLLSAMALGLTLGMPAIAAEKHDHDHAAEVIKLQLNQGKKWETDDAIRRGMSELRAVVAKAAPDIRKKAFTPAQYEALGADIMAQVNYLLANCKLPKDTDEQFHIVVEQIVKGVEEIKVPASSDQGAEKIFQALASYEKYFTHAGWQPL